MHQHCSRLWVSRGGAVGGGGRGVVAIGSGTLLLRVVPASELTDVESPFVVPGSFPFVLLITSSAAAVMCSSVAVKRFSVVIVSSVVVVMC